MVRIMKKLTEKGVTLVLLGCTSCVTDAATHEGMQGLEPATTMIKSTQPVADNLQIWVPVFSAFIGGLMAIAGGIVTQWFIARKEKNEKVQKLASDRAFIGAGLILYLKECRYQFNLVASDSGEYRNQANEEMVRIPTRHAQLPDISDIEGDWAVLPGELLLRIRQLSLRQQSTERYLEVERDVHDDYPENASYFRERRARYRHLSEECAELEKEIRALCDLPGKKNESSE